jgi:hypothetical protein
MKIKLKKKYVIWFWVGTAHFATPDEPPLDTKYYKDKLASNPSIQSFDLLYSNPFLMLISSNSKTVNRLAVDQFSELFSV